ncbi:hypothetical protein PSTG_18890, partial [Puccinia striiformis f. sp. tritici PST-78]
PPTRPLGPPKKNSPRAPANDEDSNDEEEAHHLISKFDDEDEDEPSEAESKEDVVSQDEGHHGELDIEDELTLDDIHDLEEEDEEDVYTTASCRHTLAKFRTIATKLRKSPNSKAKLVKLCEENKCGKPHNVERDVPTRWNSTYKQVASIVQCEKAM